LNHGLNNLKNYNFSEDSIFVRSLRELEALNVAGLSAEKNIKLTSALNSIFTLTSVSTQQARAMSNINVLLSQGLCVSPSLNAGQFDTYSHMHNNYVLEAPSVDFLAGSNLVIYSKLYYTDLVDNSTAYFNSNVEVSSTGYLPNA